MTMEWVTNAPKDPRDGALLLGDTGAEYAKWRGQFVEGDPKATSAFTTEQLRNMGMIGLYRGSLPHGENFVIERGVVRRAADG